MDATFSISVFEPWRELPKGGCSCCLHVMLHCIALLLSLLAFLTWCNRSCFAMSHTKILFATMPQAFARLVRVHVNSEIGSHIAGGLFQSSCGGGRVGGAIAQTCAGFGSIRMTSDRLHRCFVSIIIIFRIHASIIIFRTHASNFIEHTEHVVSLSNQEKTAAHNTKQTA
jgi:hypothetical protein